MPQIGDIKRHNNKSKGTYIWHACIDCGRERWVQSRNGKPHNLRCCSCANKGKQLSGPANSCWKGGRATAAGGYILVWISPDDFFYSMANNRGYIPEHRLVMAKHLGRNLHKWELVHHKGIKYPLGSIENKQDNRVENLMIIVTSHNNTGAHTAKMVCPYCQREFKVR